MKKDIVKKIAKFHKQYEKEILKDRIKRKNEILQSSKEALFFIFSLSFYQGRKDEVSKKFEEATRKVLENFPFEKKAVISDFKKLNKEKLLSLNKKLYSQLKGESVNKEGDRLMVINLVELSNKTGNLVKFLIDFIKQKKIKEAFTILDNVWSIGPKIASLILRDIVYIYELQNYLDKNDYQYLQPIDTWVHQVSKKIGIINKNEIYKEEAKDITDKCLQYKTNPIYFNQGAWYIGSQSFKILLDKLDKI